MALGFNNKRGITKWRLPSFRQSLTIIIIFIVSAVFFSFIYEKIPGTLFFFIAVVWFILSYGVYIYILMHGKGKEKSTITSVQALTGEFTIDNNWISFLAFYPLVSSFGALINGYYIISVMLVLTGFMIITIGRYFRKKIRIDESGNFYIFKNGEERFIDFNTVKTIVARLNPKGFRNQFKPLIIMEFNSNVTESKTLKLTFSVLRSAKFGTYSPPQLILTYIKEKCISNGFNITYLNPEETDFRAEKI